MHGAYSLTVAVWHTPLLLFGLHKGIDHRIILLIFLGLFDIYLAPDSDPLAESEGKI